MTSIMVVEDERIVAKNIEETLRLMGYDVLGSHATGADCLRQASERRPDLVLMDVRIGGDVDGIQTAKLLRSRFDVPVVFLTAYADDETVKRAREAEPHGYILKPFRASDLRAGVEIAVFKHRLESELRDRERWFSTTLRAIGDTVVTVDSEEKVTFVNRAGEALTGSTLAQLIGRSLEDVFPLVDERTGKPVRVPVREAFERAGAARIPAGSVLTRPEGDVPIEDSVAPIVDENGKLWGAVVVFHDVSEQRRLEKQLARSDRLASLGTLAAGVAHEINNPLTFVLGNVSVVLQELQDLKRNLQPILAARESHESDPATRLDYIEEALLEVNEGAERIQQIVNDLRIFARPEPVKQSGDVTASIEWALRVVGSFARERARLEVDLATIPPVRGDSARLGQVFLNLLINAVQAIPEGNPADHTIRVSTGLDAEQMILVSISDTGVGMSPELVKRIFDPFFTTKPVGSGTGLGLSICHGIVQGLGGDVTVESTLGRGSVFRVRLPQGESVSPPVPAPRVAPPEQRGRVLVVDDDILVSRAMKRMLERSHRVVMAANAGQAIDALTLDPNFDVVLCDVMMPDVSGIELFEQVGERWPHLTSRVAFITGAGFTPRVVEFLASVPNPRLTKPVQVRALLELVQTILHDAENPSA
jgi:two-component system, cell cycle sensor histidine kinase and response regulator CckA